MFRRYYHFSHHMSLKHRFFTLSCEELCKNDTLYLSWDRIGDKMHVNDINSHKTIWYSDTIYRTSSKYLLKEVTLKYLGGLFEKQNHICTFPLNLIRNGIVPDNLHNLRENFLVPNINNFEFSKQLALIGTSKNTATLMFYPGRFHLSLTLLRVVVIMVAISCNRFSFSLC